MNQTISPNTAIAHRLIAAKIGAGDMGEVYRAYDTPIDLEVAIEILPGELRD